MSAETNGRLLLLLPYVEVEVGLDGIGAGFLLDVFNGANFSNTMTLGGTHLLTSGYYSPFRSFGAPLIFDIVYPAQHTHKHETHADITW